MTCDHLRPAVTVGGPVGLRVQEGELDFTQNRPSDAAMPVGSVQSLDRKSIVRWGSLMGEDSAR